MSFNTWGNMNYDPMKNLSFGSGMGQELGQMGTSQALSKLLNGINWGGLAQGALPMIAQLLPIGNGAKGALSGGLSGAELGSMIAPGVGTAVGGGLGALAGLMGGKGGKKQGPPVPVQQISSMNPYGGGYGV